MRLARRALHAKVAIQPGPVPTAEDHDVQFHFDQTVISITQPDTAALLHEVGARLRARHGFALATINLDHLVKLARSTEFRQAYAAQDLVVADGNPIVWLSRLAGRPVRLVPGSDMVIPLVREAAAAGAPVALLGSTENVLSAAADRLRAEAPGLQIASSISPPMGFDPQGAAADAILQGLETQGIGLCLIALGAPKQEMLAARGRELAPHVGFASIGAGLDFLAGHQTRAPLLFRALALEWVWRMLSSPRRLIPRYAACIAILPGEMVKALRQRS